MATTTKKKPVDDDSFVNDLYALDIAKQRGDKDVIARIKKNNPKAYESWSGGKTAAPAKKTPTKGKK